MTADLDGMRKEYAAAGLAEADVAADPFDQFGRWFEEAKRAELIEPNAMTLATVGRDGMPSARTVLLKGVDPRGLTFFTNYESQKAQELEACGKAALLFWWPPLERQVRFAGEVTRVAAAESDAYFASRPRGSQIGAWCSPQSRVVASRAALEEAERACEARFVGQDVSRPPHWGGYRLSPTRIEFWQGRQNRLHDRLCYTRSPSGSWLIERLAP
jgi:pyridoxamine 5'-phosphate oxidase